MDRCEGREGRDGRGPASSRGRRQPTRALRRARRPDPSVGSPPRWRRGSPPASTGGGSPRPRARGWPTARCSPAGRRQPSSTRWTGLLRSGSSTDGRCSSSLSDGSPPSRRCRACWSVRRSPSRWRRTLRLPGCSSPPRRWRQCQPPRPHLQQPSSPPVAADHRAGRWQAFAVAAHRGVLMVLRAGAGVRAPAGTGSSRCRTPTAARPGRRGPHRRSRRTRSPATAREVPGRGRW